MKTVFTRYIEAYICVKLFRKPMLIGRQMYLLLYKDSLYILFVHTTQHDLSSLD